MKFSLIAASSAALMLTFSTAPMWAAETNNNNSPQLTNLLNDANQMNEEEINISDLVKDKAGDNQALTAMAQTIKDDHEANEAAVKQLASDKGVTLNSPDETKKTENKLSNLSGDAFNRAYLMDTIRDHRMQLHKFEQARADATDPAVRMYIDETTPVIESHMKIAENLHRDMSEGNHNEQSAKDQQTSSR